MITFSLLLLNFICSLQQKRERLEYHCPQSKTRTRHRHGHYDVNEQVHLTFCFFSHDENHFSRRIEPAQEMQPTYLYSSDFDNEVRWRSSFSTVIPLLLGLFQFLLALAIIGLEIGSLVISPIFGTLYAGFWAGALFLLSSLFMIGLGMSNARETTGSTCLSFTSLLPSCA